MGKVLTYHVLDLWLQYIQKRSRLLTFCVASAVPWGSKDLSPDNLSPDYLKVIASQDEIS